jgi:L-fuculose-phosphate aldolase
MDRASLSADIVETALALGPSGLGVGTAGNVSARFESGMLITPSGLPYENMTPDDIVFVDGEGAAEGSLKPSSEWRFHLDIYRARSEAAAIVHSHSPHATALACLRQGVPAFHYMVAVAGGVDIRCSDYATFGTQGLSNAILEALHDRKACLMANHGQVAFGDTLQQALGLAQEVEALAQQYLLARKSGYPVLLEAEEMAEVLERFKTYGVQEEA